MCLPEEVDPGPQQADHPARGHPSHRASRPRPQGRNLETGQYGRVAEPAEAGLKVRLQEKFGTLFSSFILTLIEVKLKLKFFRKK